MADSGEEIIFIDRKDGKRHKEIVMGDAFVRWAYNSLAGQMMFPAIFGNSIMSRLLGSFFNSSLSKGRIKKTIDDLQIDVSEFEKEPDQYSTFNDFFYRKLKADARPFDPAADKLVSPADGRIFVYDHSIDDINIRIKGCIDTIPNLFGKEMKEFAGGKIAVIRLCPADYHRFHFPCDGEIVEQGKIKGKYHSVNPIALAVKKNIFCLNKREYTIVDSDFGNVAILEVGAFGVAGIVQTYQGKDVKKMQEKGYFEFGGSTVVMLFQKDQIKFSNDLVEHSDHGYETLIRAGDTIAVKA